MTSTSSNKDWTEYFRWITPILMTASLFVLGSIQGKVNSIDDKLFKHLTNDEVHTPKSIVVTKPEFNIYQEFRNEQMIELRNGISEIKTMMDQHRRDTAVSAYEKLNKR